MREIGQTDHLPYELMSEQLVKENIENIERRYGTDPRVVHAYLKTILHEIIHDSIELGAGLAGSFPTNGAADILEAYNIGVQQGRSEGEKR